jgi:histidinol-phosphatase (PHP family)
MVDYHTHTRLCGHATGTLEEYAESAIRSGIRELGFADHAPMPDNLREGLSMSAGESEGYIMSVEKCRDAYAGRIDIRLGFEVDYPPFESFDANYFLDPRIDYLIGSCHFVDGWAFDHPRYIDGYKNRDIDELYERYYSQLQALAGSGLFNIIGHFDVVKKFGYRPKKDFRPEVERIARIASKKNVAVEINTNGSTHPVHEIYPSDQIIGILFNCNVPVTFGSDAHSSDRVGHMYAEVIEKITRAGYRKISGFKKRKRYDISL